MHDPVFNATFSLRTREKLNHRWWGGQPVGDPPDPPDPADPADPLDWTQNQRTSTMTRLLQIWITAEEQGVKAGTFFWPWYGHGLTRGLTHTLTHTPHTHTLIRGRLAAALGPGWVLVKQLPGLVLQGDPSGEENPDHPPLAPLA